jgi:hypothetical protein
LPLSLRGHKTHRPKAHQQRHTTTTTTIIIIIIIITTTTTTTTTTKGNLGNAADGGVFARRQILACFFFAGRVMGHVRFSAAFVLPASASPSPN